MLPGRPKPNGESLRQDQLESSAMAKIEGFRWRSREERLL